ncbi:hypothetical protein COHA_000626 [Chlorella ohadii]|uniref:Arylamine N-acetyltransferase n=1 Tax=Chlorella ohadii TaxID=2649997 RepID=A0AAD5E088_9CHLO|nr:hypothetical protein COHA_000626 [Chlorella ohadii]
MAAITTPYLDKYLERVGQHSGAGLPPSLSTLARLHYAHATTIPFENLSLKLDVAARQHGINIDLAAVYKKLVLSRRGGYCFEQNALFGGALRGLGFDVVDGAARVVQSSDADASEVEEAPPLPGRSPSALKGIIEEAPQLRLSGHDHHILFVQLDGRLWLADVGFGGANPLLPVLLPEGAQQYAAPAPEATAADAYAAADWLADAGLPAQRLAGYRLRLGLPGVLATPDPATTPHFGQRAGYYLQQRSSNGSWKDLYFFRLDEFLAQDFALANHYIESHPQSHFRKNLVVARQTAMGRVTILNDQFRLWREGGSAPEEERQIEGEADLLGLLRDHFGIVL